MLLNSSSPPTTFKPRANSRACSGLARSRLSQRLGRHAAGLLHVNTARSESLTDPRKFHFFVRASLGGRFFRRLKAIPDDIVSISCTRFCNVFCNRQLAEPWLCPIRPEDLGLSLPRRILRLSLSVRIRADARTGRFQHLDRMLWQSRLQGVHCW